MRFTVPQFIEKEIPIVGPFTFKQFVFIGIAGAICFFLYFTIGKTNFFLFVVACSIIGTIAASLAFLKINGRPFPTFIGNFLRFNLTPKIFIWARKELPVMNFKKEEKAEELALKIAEKSWLKKLRTQIETKTK